MCKKITLDNITSILHFQINNVNELYRMSISSSTRKNMEFQIDFFISSDQTKMNIDRSKFRFINLSYNSYPIQIRVTII